MIPPRLVGPAVFGPTRSPAERARTGRAVVPGQDALREVETFDATPARGRRELVVSPDTSSLRFLSFARIALGPGDAPAEIPLADDEEAVVYVNRGRVRVTANGEAHALSTGDVLYAGLGTALTVEADGEPADVSEFRARDCSTRYPVQVVRHADIEGTALAATVGGGRRPMTRRTVYKLVDLNVQACRLLFGDTFVASAGATGSYPPHFHGPDGPAGLGDEAKEEIYHFRLESDIPGDVPFVLQNVARPGEAVGAYVHVSDELAVNVTPGFHDTMAPPPVTFMFTWCLCAFTEGHRDWAQVVNKPGYDAEWS